MIVKKWQCLLMPQILRFHRRCAGEVFQRNRWNRCQPLTKAQHQSVRAHEVFKMRINLDEPVAAFPTLEKHCMPGTEYGPRKRGSDEWQCQCIEHALVALIVGYSSSAATLGTRLHLPGTVPIGVGQVRSDQLEGAWVCDYKHQATAILHWQH